MSRAIDGDEGIGWVTFADVPSAYIDLERLSAFAGSHISPDLCKKLKESSRLQYRLSALIADKHQLPPLDERIEEGPDRRIILADLPQLLSLVRHAGATYWSGTLASVVRRNEAAELRSRIGEDLYEIAIKHRAFSGPPQTLEPLDTLLTRIESDGWRCYAGWCNQIPPAIAARARLKAPPESLEISSHPYFREHGAKIFRQSVL